MLHMGVRAVDSNRYMAMLDQSATRPIDISMADLIDMLRQFEQNSAHRYDFTDIRKGLWFRQVDKHLGNANGNQLIELMHLILKEFPNPDHYYQGFFHNWEHALISRLSEVTGPDLISVLGLYEASKKDLPQEMNVEWCKVMGSKIDTISIDQLVEIMTLFTLLKVRPEDGFVDCWVRIIDSLISSRRLGPHHLASIVHSCGKLGIHQLSPSLIHAMQDRSIYPRLDIQEIIAAVYGFLLMKIDMENQIPGLITYFYESAARNMSSLDTGKSLSQAVWSVGRLRTEPTQEFATNWNRQFTAKINNFTAGNLGLVLDGLRMMADRGNQISTPLISTWLNRADTVINDFWPQSIARILIDLKHIRANPTREFLRKCLHIIKANLEHVYARDYAMIMISLADMGANPNTLDADFVRTWNQEAIRHGKINRWTPELKEDLKIACQKMGIYMDEDMIRALS